MTFIEKHFNTISGIVKIWEMRSGRHVFTQENSVVSAAKEDGGLSVTQLIFNAAHKNFAVITADHNIIMHSLETFACVNQVRHWKLTIFTRISVI